VKKSLKEHRESKHLTQQELAEQAGISIRTIQRVEKGLSPGSPYVLKTLCNVLGVNITDIEMHGGKPNVSETQPEEAAIQKTQNENTVPQLKWINLSVVSVLLFPLLNLLLPCALYWNYRKSLPAKPDARKIISFQIFWTIGTLAVLLFVPAVVQAFLGMREYSGHPLFFWLYLLCVFINLFVVFDTAVRLNQSRAILPFIFNIV
jgi:transcriptional regulator with XRE-family HTH domain